MGKDLRKWSGSPNRITFLPVQNVRVEIPERKYRLLLLLGQLFLVEVQPHLAAVADQAAVFPEQVNFDAGRELAF